VGFSSRFRGVRSDTAAFKLAPQAPPPPRPRVPLASRYVLHIHTMIRNHEAAQAMPAAITRARSTQATTRMTRGKGLQNGPEGEHPRSEPPSGTLGIARAPGTTPTRRVGRCSGVALVPGPRHHDRPLRRPGPAVAPDEAPSTPGARAVVGSRSATRVATARGPSRPQPARLDRCGPRDEGSTDGDPVDADHVDSGSRHTISGRSKLGGGTAEYWQAVSAITRRRRHANPPLRPR